jgi:hypothetical protein
MKQRLVFILILVLMAAVLVGLNAASYSQKQQVPDNELRPNRSTYNAGSTGTQALYTLLSETGHKVSRWQDPVTALDPARNDLPSTFVIIGEVRREITEAESRALLQWVYGGGRLVYIGRELPEWLTVSSGHWKAVMRSNYLTSIGSTDPADQQQMTANTEVARPIQPSLLTVGVNAVQPSRFASSIALESADMDDPSSISFDSEESGTANISAPIIHLAAGESSLLAEMPYGSGRIILLSDPYIVANRGISLVDNAQLAINMLARGSQPIAFDEYHQGFGNSNRFFEFFAGTPVVAIFMQCVILVAFVFFTRSRRFGRPLPASGPDRLSKLEYISAMAQLQQRTRSFDLAIENLYRDFRRRAARLLGVDNNSIGRRQFAEKIAERSHIAADKVEQLMFYCDDVIYGEPTNKNRVLQAARELREIEFALGLRKRSNK